MAATSAPDKSNWTRQAGRPPLFNRFDAADIQTRVRLRCYLPDTDRGMLVAQSCLSKGQHRTSEDISGHYGSNTVQKIATIRGRRTAGPHNMIFPAKNQPTPVTLTNRFDRFLNITVERRKR